MRPHAPTRRPRRRWQAANNLINYYDEDEEADTFAADLGIPSQQQQHMRSMNSNNMNPYPTRPGPRLQNKQSSGLGNGTGGWGGFGVPQGVGRGGFGGQLSGFAQVMGGGSGQGPIDMSDFPTLSAGPRQQQPPQNSANANANWNSNAIRQPSGQQTQQQQRAPSAAPSQQSLDQFDGQRSHQLPGDRAGSGDDFPPLGGPIGGPVNGDAIAQSSGFNSGMPSPEMQPRTTSGQLNLPIRENNGAYQQPPQPQTQLSQQQPTPSTVPKFASMTDAEKWGLPGLMAAFEARRQTDSGGPADDTIPPPQRSTVIMGHDLASLGLDLDSQEPIYPTFTPFQAIGSSESTYDFHDRHVIPSFTLPAAYTVTNVPPLSSRMGAFSDETLFTLFYTQPQSVSQQLAAHELQSRDWRWHKVLRQWLQKDSPPSATNPVVDLTNGAPVGQPSVRKDGGERGVFVFFDARNWRRERRWLDLDVDSLDGERLGGPLGVAGA